MYWIAGIQVSPNLWKKALELVEEKWAFGDEEIVPYPHFKERHVSILFNTPVPPGYLIDALIELTKQLGGWAKLEYCDSVASVIDEYFTIEAGEVIHYHMTDAYEMPDDPASEAQSERAVATA
jgi:hypothetical protein